MAQSTAPPERLRIETYVDDPIAIARGQENVRNHMFLRVIMVWLAIGHRLAWHKGQIGGNVTWISVTYRIHGRSVITTIKQELLDDILTFCITILTENVFPLAKLRTLVGKAVHVGGLIYMWRPFVKLLWAPLLLGDDADYAPKNCCWCKRIRVAALWLVAFIRGQQGSITRTFDAASYAGVGMPLCITIDASPWGIGGTLEINNVVTAYFYDAVSEWDVKLHGIVIGDHKSQQCLEALAILVALRLWTSYWAGRRIQLHVTGDNVAALTLLLDLRSSGKTLGLVARELALDIASALYAPSLVSHIPGISNVTSDALSRIPMPGSTYIVPEHLTSVKRDICEVRCEKFYRTLVVEQAFRTRPADAKSD